MPIRWLPLLLLTLLTCAPATAADTKSIAPRVRIQTTMGSFVIRLDPVRAPLTVANFLQYVKDGQYDGTLLHRVVEGFVIQGGGYTTNYEVKSTRPDIPNESGNGLSNTRGTVGLARVDDPHSGNAQFYVNLADNANLDPRPTRWGYAVFGVIVEGMDTLEQISHVPTGASGPLPDEAPLKQVVIEKAEVLR